MNVNDVILEELKYIRAKLDKAAEDVAVLKSKHDTGNRSEKISAGVAILALIVSIIVGVSACTEKQSEKIHNRKPVPVNFNHIRK